MENVIKEFFTDWVNDLRGHIVDMIAISFFAWSLIEVPFFDTITLIVWLHYIYFSVSYGFRKVSNNVESETLEEGSNEKIEVMPFEPKDYIEESVLDYYKKELNQDDLDEEEMENLYYELKDLIEDYRAEGLKHFRTDSKLKITGIFGRGDTNQSLVVKEFFRLCVAKVEELDREHKSDIKKAKHAIDKVCIKSQFWDDIYALENSYQSFKCDVQSFHSKMKDNSLSAIDRLEISREALSNMTDYAYDFEDTDKLVELVLHELSNYKLSEEKVSIMETA